MKIKYYDIDVEIILDSFVGEELKDWLILNGFNSDKFLEIDTTVFNLTYIFQNNIWTKSLKIDSYPDISLIDIYELETFSDYIFIFKPLSESDELRIAPIINPINIKKLERYKKLKRII